MQKYLFGAILIFWLLISSRECLAENQLEKSQGFSITPFSQEIILENGQVKGDSFIEILNNNDTIATFDLSIIDFGSLGETGGVAFLGSANDLKNKFGLASWLSLEKEIITLKSGETQKIQIKVKNEESLSPGGHYAAVMAKLTDNKNTLSASSSEIAFAPSFASLVFVKKIGGEIYDIKLNDVEFQHGLFDLPDTVKLRFQNIGNVYLVPRGIVKLVDPLGREVMKGIINNESALILPETSRVFSITLKNIAPILLPGKYEILVEYRYDGKDEKVIYTKDVDFMTQTAILAGLIISGLVAGYVWHKRIKKREIGRGAEEKAAKKDTE